MSRWIKLDCSTNQSLRLLFKQTRRFTSDKEAETTYASPHAQTRTIGSTLVGYGPRNKTPFGPQARNTAKPAATPHAVSDTARTPAVQQQIYLALPRLLYAQHEHLAHALDSHKHHKDTRRIPDLTSKPPIKIQGLHTCEALSCRMRRPSAATPAPAGLPRARAYLGSLREAPPGRSGSEATFL